MNRCNCAAQIHNTRVKTASKFTDQTAGICYKARNYWYEGSVSVGGLTESDCEECEGLARVMGVSTDVEC